MKADCKMMAGGAGGASPYMGNAGGASPYMGSACAEGSLSGVARGGFAESGGVRAGGAHADDVPAESGRVRGVSEGARRGRNPYDVRSVSADQPRGCLARAGMTLVEMGVWLVVMAALSLGMLWLLWTCSR